MGESTSHIATTISIESTLDLLANQHRRRMLDQLIDHHSNTVQLDALVQHVAAENPPPESGDTTDIDQPLLQCRHTHLPKLEAAGLVEYDERTEAVRYRPNDRVEKLHRFVTTELDGPATSRGEVGDRGAGSSSD